MTVKCVVAECSLSQSCWQKDPKIHGQEICMSYDFHDYRIARFLKCLKFSLIACGDTGQVRQLSVVGKPEINFPGAWKR